MINTQDNQIKKWYDNKLIVGILLVFFFPIGLFALWKSQEFSFSWKIGLSMLVTLVVINSLDGNDEATDRETSVNKFVSDEAHFLNNTDIETFNSYLLQTYENRYSETKNIEKNGRLLIQHGIFENDYNLWITRTPEGELFSFGYHGKSLLTNKELADFNRGLIQQINQEIYDFIYASQQAIANKETSMGRRLFSGPEGLVDVRVNILSDVLQNDSDSTEDLHLYTVYFQSESANDE